MSKFNRLEKMMGIKAVLAVAAVVLLSIIGVNYYNSHKAEQRIAERKADIAAMQATMPQSSEPKAVEVKAAPTAPVAVQEAPTAEVMPDSELVAEPVIDNAVKSQKEQLDNIRSRWVDEVKIAMSTPRIRLTQEIKELQGLRQEVINLNTGVCLSGAKEHLAKGMNTTIDGLLDYGAVVHGDDALTAFQESIEKANKDMAAYNAASLNCVAAQ